MADEIIFYKWKESDGDTIEMRIFRVPISEKNPEGISYSCVFIRDGKRLIAYDNFEGHKGNLRHHKHINDRIVPYQFVDEWKLVEDFNQDTEKLRLGGNHEN